VLTVDEREDHGDINVFYFIYKKKEREKKNVSVFVRKIINTAFPN